MQLRLRPATTSDKCFLYALHCATMREVIDRTWGWDESWQRGDFERRFEERIASIIEVNGRASGAVYLRSQPDLLFIVDFQIVPELQRRGIGTAVLREIIARAEGLGVPVRLAVLQVNQRGTTTLRAARIHAHRYRGAVHPHGTRYTNG